MYRTILTLATLFLFIVPAFAQRDLMDELDRQAWKEDRNRTYKPGEEVWGMVTNKTRNERTGSPMLKPRDPVMTNADILKMKAAGFSDELILSAITTRQSLFDTEPDSLIRLKQTGISEPMLNAMMAHAAS